MSKKVKVILVQNLAWYWNKGTIIEVSPAYASNVLLPKKIAQYIDDNSMNVIKQKEQKKEKDHEKSLQGFKDFVWKVTAEWGILLQKQTTHTGKLYAKIDEKDILKDILMKYKISLPKWSIKMDKIEEIWEYQISFHFETIDEKIKLIIKA